MHGRVDRGRILVGKDEANIERERGCRSPRQCRAPVAGGEVELDEDGGGPRSLRDRGRRRGVGRRRRRHGDRGKGGSLLEPEARHGMSRHRGRSPRHRDVDRLHDALTRGEGVGEGQRERAAVGLVRGIRPVALILHLEHVAGEPHIDLESVVRPRQAGDVEGGLMWADAHGEPRVRDRSVRVADVHRRARESGRVQHDEPRAVRRERALRLQVGEHPQATGAAHLGPHDPAQLHAEAARSHVQRHGEVARVDPVDHDHSRVPVAVADDRTHRAQHHAPVVGDVGEFVVAHLERPGPAPPGNHGLAAPPLGHASHPRLRRRIRLPCHRLPPERPL